MSKIEQIWEKGVKSIQIVTISLVGFARSYRATFVYGRVIQIASNLWKYFFS